MKHTDYFADEVVITAIAVGGLSEVRCMRIVQLTGPTSDRTLLTVLQVCRLYLHPWCRLLRCLWTSALRTHAGMHSLPNCSSETLVISSEEPPRLHVVVPTVGGKVSHTTGPDPTVRCMMAVSGAAWLVLHVQHVRCGVVTVGAIRTQTRGVGRDAGRWAGGCV